MHGFATASFFPGRFFSFFAFFDSLKAGHTPGFFFYALCNLRLTKCKAQSIACNRTQGYTEKAINRKDVLSLCHYPKKARLYASAPGCPKSN